MTYPEADYRRAVESAVLFDLAERSFVEVAGKDARSFLHNLCTADTKGLSLGQSFEGFLTTAKARVVAHLWGSYHAFDAEPVVLLDTVPGQGATILKHLDHYLISEQVELADRTNDFALLRVAGPRATEIASTLEGVFVRKQALLSVPSFDLIVPISQKAALVRKLADAGVTPADLAVHNVLRLEAGTPEFGSDIDDNRFAMEVNRVAQAICYTKGCYLGQETIVMARDRGQVNRLLFGVRGDGEPLAPGTKLLHNGEEVGVTASSALSPRLGQAIALAYLKRGHQQPGSELTTESGRKVLVSVLPFV